MFFFGRNRFEGRIIAGGMKLVEVKGPFSFAGPTGISLFSIAWRFCTDFSPVYQIPPVLGKNTIFSHLRQLKTYSAPVDLTKTSFMLY